MHAGYYYVEKPFMCKETESFMVAIAIINGYGERSDNILPYFDVPKEIRIVNSFHTEKS
jgi:hypothetical protein